ncbi:hypothetical protein TCAL_08434 [Tigriopus californicus]|uniref:Ig-like domain-containing protein n=1 Tax=Tigriopus californicus TaxID=6832 RepID=A0A553P2F8_TIGCA|nr:lachesin-like [Tigriopus californicus]TRY71885.1 hypothetical protein TCAL_08434 [Tigriopus californicus]
MTQSRPKFEVIASLFALSLFLGVQCSPVPNEADYEEEEMVSTDNPDFISTSSIQTVAVGRRLKLVCQVNDLGELPLIWMKGGNEMLTVGSKMITKDTRFQFRKLDGNTGMTLTLEPVEKADATNYTCTIAINPPKAIQFDVQVVDPSELTNEITEAEPETDPSESKFEDHSETVTDKGGAAIVTSCALTLAIGLIMALMGRY